jgi:hypothetical protein
LIFSPKGETSTTFSRVKAIGAKELPILGSGAHTAWSLISSEAQKKENVNVGSHENSWIADTKLDFYPDIKAG